MLAGPERQSGRSSSGTVLIYCGVVIRRLGVCSGREGALLTDKEG